MNVTLNEMADTFLDKLKTTFPDYEVDDYPDNPAKYQLAHPNGAVLLTLQDRKFEDPMATDGTGQGNEPIFQVTFLTRSLRSKNRNEGAYNMLDTAREALKGLEFSRGYASILREFYIQTSPGGVWYFGQDWTHYDFFE